jgi:hypothetical protein
MGVDISGINSKSEDGDYFGSNWWAWRPIHILCEHANEHYELNLFMGDWGSNDGGGLPTQEECDKLAAALKDIISSELLKEDDDRLYLCLGSWVDSDNHFLSEDETKSLNEQYFIGELLYGGVITDDGNIVHPSHSCSKGHVDRFISFLRECGGFEIW